MIVKNIKIVQYSRKYFYKKTFCECKKNIYLYGIRFKYQLDPLTNNRMDIHCTYHIVL